MLKFLDSNKNSNSNISCNEENSHPLAQLNSNQRSVGSKEYTCREILEIYSKASKTNNETGLSHLVDDPLENLRNRSKFFKDHLDFANKISAWSGIFFSFSIDIPMNEETRKYYEVIFESPPEQGMSGSTFNNFASSPWYGLTSNQKMALLNLIQTKFGNDKDWKEDNEKMEKLKKHPFVLKDFSPEEYASLNNEANLAWDESQKILGSKELISQCLKEDFKGYKEAIQKCPKEEELITTLLFDKFKNSQIKEKLQTVLPGSCDIIVKSLLESAYQDSEVANKIREIFEKHKVFPLQGNGSEKWDLAMLETLDQCYSKIPDKFKKNMPPVKLYKDKNAGNYSSEEIGLIFIDSIDCHGMLHEYGHQFADRLLKKKNPSMLTKWKEDGFVDSPFKNSLSLGASVSLSVPKNRIFLTDYAKSDENEDFAEFFAFMFYYPEMINLKVPERKNLFLEVIEAGVEK